MNNNENLIINNLFENQNIEEKLPTFRKSSVKSVISEFQGKTSPLKSMKDNLKIYQSLFLSRFQQQNFNGWKFVPNFWCSFIFFLTIGIFLFIFGIIHVILSSNLIEFSKNYDKECENQNRCIIKIQINEEIKGPVFFYYGIKHYYQNYRNYVKSIDYNQIGGKYSSHSELEKNCDPVDMNKDLDKQYSNFSSKGFLLNRNKRANPCGLVAKSFFNDSFVLFNIKNETIKFEFNDISYHGYRDYLFKKSNSKSQHIDHFINWAKFSTTSYWKKLWARIPYNLKSGIYFLQINNNYDVSKFKAIKTIYISNSSPLGGKDYFLGGFFLTGSGIYILLSIWIITKKKKIDEIPNPDEIDYDWKN